MIVTDDEEIFKRCFAFHDQGHSPLRTRRRDRAAAVYRPRLPLHRAAGGRAPAATAKAAADRRAGCATNKRRYKEIIADAARASSSASFPIPRATWRRC